MEQVIEAPRCDLCTAFGFMHHVPGKEARAEVLRVLADKSCGYAVVSFWQFADDENRKRKAEATTAEALAVLPPDLKLDPGDYLIGWNAVPGVLRYCHSFDSCEIDELLQDAGLQKNVVVRFQADGKTGCMNAYVVLDCTFR